MRRIGLQRSSIRRRFQPEPLEDRSLPSLTLLHDLNPTPVGEIKTAQSGIYWATDLDGNGSTELVRFSDELQSPLTLGSFDFVWLDGGVEIDAVLYFGASAAFGGDQIWRTDGTVAGTHRVTSFEYGLTFDEELIYNESLGWTVLGSHLIFPAYDAEHGRELWQLNHDTGQYAILRDTRPGSEIDGLLQEFSTAVIGSFLYYPSAGGLWRTDGTSVGTVPILNAVTGLSPAAGKLTGVGDTVFFVTASGSGEIRLACFTATQAASVQVRVLTQPTISVFVEPDLVALDSRLVFSAGDQLYDWELWSSDGTDNGTRLLLDEPFTGSLPTPTPMRRVGDRVVFFAEDADHGYEPWSTDGTTEGTSLLRDVFPGPLSPFHSVGYSGWLPVTLAASRSQHVFLADDGVHGREPWITDGTPENTRLLADTRPGWQHGYLGAITASDSHVSFTSSSDNQNHFWITDGPTGKARVAHSIATARTEGSEWVRSFDLGNRTLFFAGFDDYGRFLPHDPEYQYHEYDLFVTDGTPQGTARLAQFRSVNLDEAVVLGSRLYFTANDGRTGTEVWVTDGTRAGTVRLTDLDPSFGVYGPDPRELTVLGDWVYFSANDGIHDRELWRTEGTLANTQMVVDLDPTLTEYDDSSNPTDLTSFGGHLYFSAFTPEGGLQLWRTDGTEAGTTVPVDLSPGLTHYPPRDIAVAGGHLYVAGYSRELWKTDGTPEGTFLVHEFTNEDPPVYIVRFAHTTDSSAYFLVDRDDGQVQSLWRTDGTGEGTIKLTDFEEHTPGGVRDIYDFRDVGANELFLVQDVLGAVHLWCTDGTPTGTRFLSDYGSQFFDSRPSLLGVLYQDEFFFRGYSPSNPELTAETWKSNGTASGTESLQRTQPANIFEVWTHSGLVATESGVYFGVNRYLGGPPLTRIFTTTGVPDTTALLDALPTLLTFEGAIGGNLLVRANSPQGDEPHLYRLPEPLVLSPIPNATISEGVPWSYQSLAADPEGRALRFELAPGAPSGLFVNALTGLLTWTPAEWQGPGVYPVTVIVRDPQIPGRQAARSFQIEARESNAPPTLRPLSPTTITVNQRLTFFASAWDTDLPEQSLTYSLDANAPPGAVIDPLTGRFSWTPAAPGSYAINIRVTDNGSPPLSASQTLNLIVQARPGVPNPPGPPVRVVSLTLLPLNRRRPISSLVLLFDGPLHRASAQAKLNYRLALPGPDGLFGTADDRVQRIQSIIYNLRSNIVILRPRTALSRAKTYLLVLNGVKDATGRSIDGDGDGQPGGPFIRYLRAGVVSPALSLWSRSPHSAAHTA